VDRILSN
jgi:hypothetical protein